MHTHCLRPRHASAVQVPLQRGRRLSSHPHVHHQVQAPCGVCLRSLRAALVIQFGAKPARTWRVPPPTTVSYEHHWTHHITGHKSSLASLVTPHHDGTRHTRCTRPPRTQVLADGQQLQPAVRGQRPAVPKLRPRRNGLLRAAAHQGARGGAWWRVRGGGGERCMGVTRVHLQAGVRTASNHVCKRGACVGGAECKQRAASTTAGLTAVCLAQCVCTRRDLAASARTQFWSCSDISIRRSAAPGGRLLSPHVLQRRARISRRIATAAGVVASTIPLSAAATAAAAAAVVGGVTRTDAAAAAAAPPVGAPAAAALPAQSPVAAAEQPSVVTHAAPAASAAAAAAAAAAADGGTELSSVAAGAVSSP
jgi:hypothetical protein